MSDDGSESASNGPFYDLIVAIGNQLAEVPVESRATTILVVRHAVNGMLDCVAADDWPPGTLDEREFYDKWIAGYRAFFPESKNR